MTKHEEAMTDLRKIAESITSKQWLKLTLNIERLRGYISEQEKKDKLLELYREHMNTLCKKAREGVKDSMFLADHIAYETYQQIKALEEEMK